MLLSERNNLLKKLKLKFFEKTIDIDAASMCTL